MVFPDLSKIQAFVHTSWRRIGEIAWKLLRIIVTLHQKSEIIRFIHKLVRVSLSFSYVWF